MSQVSAWRTFGEERRVALHGDYPCAMPTQRRGCPKHGARVPQEMVVRATRPGDRPPPADRVPLSGICKSCRDELYAHVAAEYVALEHRAVA
jgi:hypothetical protein